MSWLLLKWVSLEVDAGQGLLMHLVDALLVLLRQLWQALEVVAPVGQHLIALLEKLLGHMGGNGSQLDDWHVDAARHRDLDWRVQQGRHAQVDFQIACEWRHVLIDWKAELEGLIADFRDAELDGDCLDSLIML